MEIDVALRSYDIPHVWPEKPWSRKRASSNRSGGEGQGAPGRPTSPAVRHHRWRRCPRLRRRRLSCEEQRSLETVFRWLETLCRHRRRVRTTSRSVRRWTKKAQSTGNSVYFPERVVPMLPEELSNGLCSLNPHVDRLAMVCEMNMSKSARRRLQFYEAVIHSHARLTYNKVSPCWSSPRAPAGQGAARRVSGGPAAPQAALCAVPGPAGGASRAWRHRLRNPGNRIVFGAGRKIAEIRPTQRNDAHNKLIEECMLAATWRLRRARSPDAVAVSRADGPPAERVRSSRPSWLSWVWRCTRASGADAEGLPEAAGEHPGSSGLHPIQTVMLRR